MNTLIKNASILTNGEKDYENGQIFIENNTIAFVGQKYEAGKKADKIIDAKDKLVMAGFINAHAHSAMSILKNISDDTTLEEWLYEHMFKLEAKFSKKTVYDATMLAIMEYVKNGITTVGDMYIFEEASLLAFEKTGLRATMCIGLHPEDGIKKIKEVEEFYLKHKDNELINFMIYAHSTYTKDEAELTALINLAHKYKLPIYTHMSETVTEVSNCVVKNNGLTPPMLLEQLGFFDLSATVAHAVHIDKGDIDILSGYNVNVVSCPASNLKLGSGIAPVNALVEAGVNVALGTDGEASNNRLDMFREMYLASTLQKAQLRDASVMNARKVLTMATVNGAYALNIKKVGKLVKGYKADIIMLDKTMPNLTPLNNAYSAVVYSAGSENICFTMVNGKVLYENGEFYLNENADTILKNANDVVKTLKK